MRYYLVIFGILFNILFSQKGMNAKGSGNDLLSENPIYAIPIAKELNAFAINPNHKKLSHDIIKKIQMEGFKVYTWTVNDINHISKLISWGVDAIITDYPEYVLR